MTTTTTIMMRVSRMINWLGVSRMGVARNKEGAQPSSSLLPSYFESKARSKTASTSTGRTYLRFLVRFSIPPFIAKVAKREMERGREGQWGRGRPMTRACTNYQVWQCFGSCTADSSANGDQNSVVRKTQTLPNFAYSPGSANNPLAPHA